MDRQRDQCGAGTRLYHPAFVIRQSSERSHLPLAQICCFQRYKLEGETAFFPLIKRNKPAVSSFTRSMEGVVNLKI